MEWLMVSDVEDDHEGMSSLVIWTSDRSKLLLSSSIPYLQLDVLLIAKERLETEVDTDRSQKDITELIISIADDDWGLSHARVADQHHLEEIQKIIRSHLAEMDFQLL